MTLHTVPTTSDHIAALAAIVDATLFPAEMLPEAIAPYLAGAEDQFWLTALQDDTPVGLSFARAEEFADSVWNMKALAVAPLLHRHGIGRGLVTATEDAARGQCGRLLVVDTSSDPAQAPAVAFYQAIGYDVEGRVRNFWAEGEDRITLARRL